MEKIISNCVCTECLKDTPTESKGYLRATTYKERCQLLNTFCFNFSKMSKDFEKLDGVLFSKESFIQFVRALKKRYVNKNLRILTTRMYQFELLTHLRYTKQIPGIDLFYEQYLEGLTQEHVMYLEIYEGCPLLLTNKFFTIPMLF